MIDTTPLLGYGKYISLGVKQRIRVLQTTEEPPVHKIDRTSYFFTLGQPPQDAAYVRIYRALLLAQNPEITLNGEGGHGEEATETTKGRKPVTTELFHACCISLAKPPGSHDVYNLLVGLASNPTPQEIQEVLNILSSS